MFAPESRSAAGLEARASELAADPAAAEELAALEAKYGAGSDDLHIFVGYGVAHPVSTNHRPVDLGWPGVRYEKARNGEGGKWRVVDMHGNEIVRTVPTFLAAVKASIAARLSGKTGCASGKRSGKDDLQAGEKKKKTKMTSRHGQLCVLRVWKGEAHAWSAAAYTLGQGAPRTASAGAAT